MKIILFATVCLIVCACGSQTPKPVSKPKPAADSRRLSVSAAPKYQRMEGGVDFPFRLKGDSGYLPKTEVYKMLRFFVPGEQREWIWDLHAPSDTVGKYVYLRDLKTYIVCLNDYSEVFETHVLIAVDNKDDKLVYRNMERYYHGNYPCCWNGEYEGFFQWEGMAVLKTCGTGSSLCSESMSFFHTVTPQKVTPAVLTQWSIFEEGLYSIGDSKLSVKKDQIIVRYDLEKGKIDSRGEEMITIPEKKWKSTTRCQFRDHRFSILDPEPEIW